jgi:hypothetical protein
MADHVDRLETAFSDTADDDERAAALARLQSLVTRWDTTYEQNGKADTIETATTQELLDFIDDQVD